MGISWNPDNQIYTKEKKSLSEMARFLHFRLEAMRPEEKNFVNESLTDYSKFSVHRDIEHTRLVTSKEKYLGDETIPEGLEASLVISAQENNWFSNAEALPTAKYDDVVGGADAMILDKTKENQSGVGITFDTTTTSLEKVMANKVYRNLKDCVLNEFFSPKYLKKDTPKDKSPKLPVGIFACSPESASRFIEATFQKNIQVQNDFKVLFFYQLRVFLETSLEVAQILAESDDKDIQIKAKQSLLVLHDAKAFLDKNDDVSLVIPDYLSQDSVHQNFMQELEKSKDAILKQYAQPKQVRVLRPRRNQ